MIPSVSVGLEKTLEINIPRTAEPELMKLKAAAALDLSEQLLVAKVVAIEYSVAIPV